MVSTLIVFACVIGYILIISAINLIKLIAAGRVITSVLTPPQQPTHRPNNQRRNARINALPTYAPTSQHIITTTQQRGRCVVCDNGEPVGFLLITGNVDATIKGIDGRVLFIDKNDDNRPAPQFKNRVISNYNEFLKTME